MKDYQDLTVLTTITVDEIVTKMEAIQSAGWKRNHAIEEQFGRTSRSFRFIVFECDTCESRYMARVSLLVKGDNSLELSNIYPLGDAPNPLGIDNYNVILRDFYSFIIKPLEDKGILTATLFAGEFDIKVELGESVFGCLKGFSDAANKSTGSGHWCDQRRWFEFLTAFHRSGASLDVGSLRRWLNESEGWGEEQAMELALEFEFATALLEFYDPVAKSS